MQKGNHHKFKLTVLNVSAWGLAVQDLQVSGDYSAPKPEKLHILSRMFGRNTSDHCSKIFHEHEVCSLQKWTTCILFSFYPYLFSTSQQPTVQFTAKTWTLGQGRRWTVPRWTTSSLVKQHNSYWLPGSYTHWHQLKICLFSYKKNNRTHVTWSCIKNTVSSHSRQFVVKYNN